MRFLDQLMEAMEAPDLPDEDKWTEYRTYVSTPELAHDIIVNLITDNTDLFKRKFRGFKEFASMFEAYLYSYGQGMSGQPNKATRKRWVENLELDLWEIMGRLARIDLAYNTYIFHLNEFLNDVPTNVTEAIEAPDLPDEDQWTEYSDFYQPDFEIFAFFFKDEHEYSDQDVVDKLLEEYGDKLANVDIDTERTNDWTPIKRTARQVYMYGSSRNQEFYNQLLRDMRSMRSSKWGNWKGESVLNFKIDGITYTMDPIERDDEDPFP